MLQAKWLRGSEDLSPALEIREKVFVEEQGFSIETERDENDQRAMHLLILDDEVPVATGRMFVQDETLTFGRIAVLQERRGEKLGDLLMRVMLDLALRMGAEEIRLGAQLPVVEFYKKYGFEEVGDHYEEEGVAHKHMLAKAETIEALLFSGCGSSCGGGCGGGCSGCSGCGSEE